MPKKIKNKTKLNWFTITRKYWKETIIFYVLTTLSCFGNLLIDNNAWTNIAKKIESGEKAPYTLNWDFKLFDFGSNNLSRNAFIFSMVVIIIIYCLIVIAHVYYSYYLASRIIRAVKKKITKKIFSLQNVVDKKKAVTLLTHNSRDFSYLTIFVPNQLYYALLGSALTFWYLKDIGGTILWLGIAFFCLILLINAFLQRLFFKKELSFQKPLEKETKEENFLIENRDLIIKKNLISSSLNSYNHLLDDSQKFANRRNWVYTLSFVIPSYSLGQIGGFIFLPFASSHLAAYQRIVKLSESTKKMTERLKDYPVGLAAQKRINSFLAKKDRDDIQRNIVITEPIESIILKKVSFAYEEKKSVLKKIDWEFCKGKVNHLQGENGFGKSTIISLIMGLYQPNKGEVLINGNYKLNEINLIKWREKIAYAEHENLIENGLSTGQKQLVDLNNLFATKKDKEIFIFDEADNALDENNKKEFRQKIEKISKKKLVILISH